MRALGIVLRAAAVVAVGLVAGGLTPLGQQHLPDAVRSFANSSGGWAIILVVAVWISRLGPVAAAITGALMFLAMLAGYDLVSAWRGVEDRSLVGFWGAVAIVAGPLLGVATAWLRSRRRVLAAVGVLVIVTPLLGEAAYGLTVIRGTTSPVYWCVQATLAIALPGVIAFTSQRRILNPAHERGA
jgi:hypothetical protein